MSSTSSELRSPEIFDLLSRGSFICSNAIDSKQRGLYAYIEEHSESLSSLYKQVGFSLETGNNYYYFSKENENNQSIENKVTRALRWLDVLSFFSTFRKDLCRGARFSPTEVLAQIDLNVSLKDQLIDLHQAKSKTKESNYQEMLDTLLRELRGLGFIDLENEREQKWRILDAWDYMERMVLAVSISEE